MSSSGVVHARRHRKPRTGANAPESGISCKQQQQQQQQLNNQEPKTGAAKRPRYKPKSESPTEATLLMREHLSKIARLPDQNVITKFLALDCEFIATVKSKQHVARISVVNTAGSTILDAYIAPDSRVIGYRTRWSGISKDTFQIAEKRNVLWSSELLKPVLTQLFANNVVVGHALHNDFRALKLNPNDYTLIDTQVRKDYGKARRGLKNLMSELHEIEVQNSDKGHCSVEDAAASMYLFIQDMEMYMSSIPAKKNKN